MGSRPKSSGFDILNGAMSFVNTVQLSKLRKSQKSSHHNLVKQLNDSQSSIFEQTIKNQMGLEVILKKQIDTFKAMGVIGSVLTNMLDNQNDLLNYYKSKDLAKEVLGDQKNVLLDIEEQYDELKILSEFNPEYAYICAESLIEICDRNQISENSFKSIDFSDLREVREIIKKIRSGPKSIKLLPNWSEENHSKLIEAYQFLDDYTEKSIKYQNQATMAGDMIHESNKNKKKLLKEKTKLLENVRMLESKKMSINESINEISVLNLESKLLQLQKKFYANEDKLEEKYFFIKRRTFSEGMRTIEDQQSLLIAQASKTTFFRTQRVLDDELAEAKKEPSYIQALKEGNNAKRESAKLRKEISKMKSKIKRFSKVKDEAEAVNSELNESISKAKILDKTIKDLEAVIIKNQKLVPKLMKKLDLLNQKLGESQGIITKLTPDKKLIGE